MSIKEIGMYLLKNPTLIGEVSRNKINYIIGVKKFEFLLLE